jgi:Fe-S-cluster containining protein
MWGGVRQHAIMAKPTQKIGSRVTHSAFADAQRPSTWVPYKRGLCEGCWGGCCTLPVEVSAVDLMRLGLTDEMEAGASLKKLAKRLSKLGIIQAYQQKTQLFILAQVQGRDCLYLHPETRLCTVYENRPEVCRQFPKIGPRPGFCPAKLKDKKPKLPRTHH